MKNIFIFCGGNSSEHEVSVSSTKSILEACIDLPYNFSVLYILKNLKCIYINEPRLPSNSELTTNLKSLEEQLSDIKDSIDLAFLAGIHGGFAENGTLQHILDNFKIKYSGSNAKVSKVCMDKDVCSQVVSASVSGIFFPESETVSVEKKHHISYIPFPLIAKPNNDGSSNFVRVINNQKELDTYFEDFSKGFQNGKIILQAYISGIELSCGCLNTKNGEFVSLPPVEIIPNRNNFFDYSSKYEDGGAIEICPPKSLDTVQTAKISKKAVEIHKILGCRLYSRSDFILKNDKLYYLETNTLPGMTKNSLIPKETREIGMNFKELINFLIQNSL